MYDQVIIEAPANRLLQGIVHLPASKSLSNRALILQAISTQPISIENLSDAEDTRVLKNALESVHRGEAIIDVGHAGTAMRFLTAYLVIQEGSFELKGSKRMHQRPIAPLVDALRQLGAEIHYLGQIGFPPLLISGKKLKGGKVSIVSDISSQFISALLLIAPTLPNGLTLEKHGIPASPSYVTMTMGLLKKAGISCNWAGNTISIGAGNFSPTKIVIEPDWSSASYFYSAILLAKEGELFFPGLQQESLQGDAILAHWFKELGVQTHFNSEGARVTKVGNFPAFMDLNFKNQPDLAQTMAMAFAGCGIQGQFKGLETLPRKETDRIKALLQELRKLGYALSQSDEGAWQLRKSAQISMERVPVFQSYEDHRMAMACAPLALCTGKVLIEDPEVVVKSYPKFWENMANIGFTIDYQKG
ncbi:MAG TPA: 3-phosphoshikimate 1-carboxyvinyltransferase [Bacteroidales bacterium]|nr:3-phosphoshikimate 1-carboxyvinyltransferase [Bacteroidales bacterium]